MINPKDYHQRGSSKTLTNFDLSQSSECDDKRINWTQQKGRGLIECLMNEQSSEIQRLNNQIRLLMSKNQYLKKDNKLLQNQITYLNQQIQCLCQSKKKPQSIQQLSNHFDSLTKSFQHQLSLKLQQIQQRETNLTKKILQLSNKLKKQKNNKNKLQLDQKISYKLFQLQIQNKKLSIRVEQLQKKINQLNQNYLQTFQWKPYLIPQFIPHKQQTSKPIKFDLKLDLRKLNKQTAQPNASLFVY